MSGALPSLPPGLPRLSCQLPHLSPGGRPHPGASCPHPQFRLRAYGRMGQVFPYLSKGPAAIVEAKLRAGDFVGLRRVLRARSADPPDRAGSCAGADRVFPLRVRPPSASWSGRFSPSGAQRNRAAALVRLNDPQTRPIRRRGRPTGGAPGAGCQRAPQLVKGRTLRRARGRSHSALVGCSVYRRRRARWRGSAGARPRAATTFISSATRSPTAVSPACRSTLPGGRGHVSLTSP